MLKDPAPFQKVVLLTGATSGIGESFARQLAAQTLVRPGGGKIGMVITGRNLERLQSLASSIGHVTNVECLPIVADLADPDAPQVLIEKVIATWGRLDVLGNNAGYGLPRMFHQASAAEITAQIQVDFTAPVMLTRLALPYLLKSPAGRVIQVSSSISTTAWPIFGAYGACKAGLSYFTDGLRRELHDTRVAVCLVEPGPIRTEFLSRALEGLDPADPMRKMVESWPPMIFGDADRVAKDMLRLIDRPRGRISVLRRIVWPIRWMGALFQLVPWLGD
ncbi:MAG: SDR family NAD(P)-dependent oxidoreductase, partial [bacterium]